jgi:hypothetical protein
MDDGRRRDRHRVQILDRRDPLEEQRAHRSSPLARSSSSGRAGGGICITPDDLQRVAFAALGLYLLIDLVPSVMRQALESGSLPDMDRLELPGDLKTRMLANLVGAVVQAIVAMWLLLYPDGLIGLIARVRRRIAPEPSA